MTIRLTTTTVEGQQHGVKALVYGLAGTGKTTLCKTAPSPVIISNEGGLLALRNENIPVIVVESYDDLNEAYEFIRDSDDAKQFKTICLDSISEIAEVVLAYEKAKAPDPRQAYGEMQMQTTALCRKFRDLPNRHVYFSAKQAREADSNKVIMNLPSLPGRQLPQELPYMFDLVMCLRAEEDESGTLERRLQTQPTYNYVAKDRSGALKEFEPADLSNIINKITRGNS